MIQEARAVPYQATSIPAPGHALVFAPHPDDEVFGCGGAILAHLGHGYSVQVVVLTDGGAQADTLEQRRRESIAAGATLGYGEPEFWDYPDRSLEYGERLVSRIQRRITDASVAVVYAPSPWEVHPDHLAASMATIEAVRRLGGDVLLALYEVGAPLQPNTLLDLTPHLEKKRARLSALRPNSKSIPMTSVSTG